MDIELIKRLSQPSEQKVLFCVIDGLGGLPGPAGETALEAAATPNLDRLASEGSQGRTLPVGFGITPGSGPGHLALFGYDPLTYEIGRGALEATGIDFTLTTNDLAARGNLCDLSSEGLITDRRAGRLDTEITARVCDSLSDITLDQISTHVLAVREQRFVVIFRGDELSDDISETDPQQENVAALTCKPLNGTIQAERTASVVRRWVNAAHERLSGRDRGNGLLLRGWSTRPTLPDFSEIWKMRSAACAVYPMYRGVASLVGMEIIDAGSTINDQIKQLENQWADYEFFFMHYKYADSAGEDGDFSAKVQAIEEFDKSVPEMLALEPDVVVVAGDHSTPAVMAAHSWHPVPVLIYGKDVRSDLTDSFGERSAIGGELGLFPAKELMPLALAHAGKLAKYGA